MAPNPELPKRRRGRPANASATTVNPGASQTRPEAAEEYEADIEEHAQPRKRGRPRRSLDSQDGAPPADPKPKKRGRPSLGGAKPAATDTTEGQPQARKRPREKKGRLSVENERQEEREGGGEEQPPKRRGRKKNASADETARQQEQAQAGEVNQPKRRGRKPTSAEQQTEAEPPKEAQRRKRGRPSLEKIQDQEAQAENTANEPSRPRKRRRASLQEVEAGEAQNRSERPTREKREAQETANQENEPENQDARSGKGKRGRPSLGSNDGAQPKPKGRSADGGHAPEEAPNARRGRRRSSQDAPSDDNSLPSPDKPYLHLIPRTRRIRPSTIATKWAPLNGASVPAAASLLQLAQQPILQRMASSTQRRGHSQAALKLIMHRIGKKLAKGLPFPPAMASSALARRGRPRKNAHGLDADGGREVELDFESVLDGKTLLERQLDPVLHAVQLLRREKARMEKELERDYETLRQLESSARAQARERKDQLRKAHVLAPARRTTPPPDQETVIVNSSSDGNVFKDIAADKDLHPLALQLADHAESIRGNLSQAAGIVPQLSQTRAALRDVLSRHLERSSYEQVILG